MDGWMATVLHQHPGNVRRFRSHLNSLWTSLLLLFGCLATLKSCQPGPSPPAWQVPPWVHHFRKDASHASLHSCLDCLQTPSFPFLSYCPLPFSNNFHCLLILYRRHHHHHHLWPKRTLRPCSEEESLSLVCKCGSLWPWMIIFCLWASVFFPIKWMFNLIQCLKQQFKFNN